MFPWSALQSPLLNHFLIPLFQLNPWNPNSYKYFEWFGTSGMLANSALWGFSIVFLLLPEKFRKKIA